MTEHMAELFMPSFKSSKNMNGLITGAAVGEGVWMPEEKANIYYIFSSLEALEKKFCFKC